MKKVIWIWLILISFNCGYSQVVAQSVNTVSLNFCTSVESASGYCNFMNTKFITSPDSTRGRIFMQVKSNSTAPIGATSLIFKVYKLDKDGSEKFETMMQQPIQANWLFAWMPYNFNSPAKYTVKVYNESDQLICTKGFELIAFK